MPTSGQMPAIPYVKGRFQRVFPPPGQAAAQQTGSDEPWYVNDHCFLVTQTDEIHWFGITNPFPREGSLYGPGSHHRIGHASAEQPFGPWHEHEHAFELPEGSPENIGASYVVARGGAYYMLHGYNTGLWIARSSDLFEWHAIEGLEVVWLGEGTRDPCVVEIDAGQYLLYCAAGHEGMGSVALASSSDLLTWRPEPHALVSDVPGGYGPLESPFVLRHGEWFYLFVNHSHHQYEETLVLASRNPYHFDWKAPLCTLFGHACEVFVWQGRQYISHCGIEDRHWGAESGLYLAELGWLDPA